MANAKIINYGQPIGAGSTAIPDNTSEALDIESTDSGTYNDYVVIDTTDSGEKLRLSAGAERGVYVESNRLRSDISGEFACQLETPSATNPVFLPKNSDPDTGIGHAADDQLSLIAGATEVIRATSKRGATVNGSTTLKGKASFVLTGSIDVTGTNVNVPGTGTKFLSELAIGDTILVSGESRVVATVTNDTTATVTAAWGSDLANDTSPECSPAALSLTEDGGALAMVVNEHGRVGIGASAQKPDEVLRVRANHTSDTLSLFENTGAGVALEAQTNSTSNSVDILRTKNSSGVTFGCRADGVVFVGTESTTGYEFEVNNGTQAIGMDVQGTTSAINVLGRSNSIKQTLQIGGSQGPGIVVSKYGTSQLTYQLGQTDAWDDDQTNANRSAYLADSNTDLILDMEVGVMGIIELVDNIDKIKLYNLPSVGRVRTFTLRIKQHASSAKPVSYSTIEFYTDEGSTAVSGAKTLTWSGGAAHVMSTGTGDFDIVQFTAFSDTANTIQVYGSVIGQNFS